MKFCLLINASAQWQTSHQHALSLVRTLCDAGHQVNAVFMYGEAVRVIENQSLVKAWQRCYADHEIPLLLCSTQLANLDLDQIQEPDGFEVVGLASLTQAMETADRTVELT